MPPAGIVPSASARGGRPARETSARREVGLSLLALREPPMRPKRVSCAVGAAPVLTETL